MARRRFALINSTPDLSSYVTLSTLDNYVEIGTTTQTDDYTYLNRTSASEDQPALHVAYVGSSGSGIKVGQAPSLGSTTYSDELIIKGGELRKDDDYLDIAAGNGNLTALRMKGETSNSIFGYFYADANGIGVLHDGGGWSIQVHDTTHEIQFHDNVIINTGDGGNMLTLEGTSPQLYFKDNDASSDDFWIHVNSNNFYILSDTNDSGSWAAPYPLQLEADTEASFVFGEYIATGTKNGGSYWGFGVNGDYTSYMRTPVAGIIPYQSGGGTSVVGTSGWPFTDAAFKTALFSGGVDTPVRFQNCNVVGSPNATIGNDALHVGYQVKGGAFDSTTSSHTGYCRIRWPISTTNDSCMMTMMIHGYNYSGTNGDIDGGHWCVAVSGYFYSTENWHNTSARIVSGSPPFDIVRFGESETGDYKYILLGESTSQWDYPKVWLTDLTGGHSTQYTDWLNGTWNIDFSASAPSGWSQDSTASPVYIGGQIRWDGEGGTSANDKNLGGRVTISTSAASGGQNGDIWFQY